MGLAVYTKPVDFFSRGQTDRDQVYSGQRKATYLSYNVIPLLIDVMPTAALIQQCLLTRVQEAYVKQLNLKKTNAI